MATPLTHAIAGAGKAEFDPASAFEAGNYAAVALNGSPSDWRYHAARGLLVDPKGGIQRLDAFDHPEARFFQAVLSWIAGDEDAACRGLERSPGEHTSALLRLIRKPRIEVLSQMPPMRDGAFVLLDGIAGDRKFSVRNIGDGAGDLKNAPYGPLSSLYDPSCPPDYFVCSNVEWHSKLPVDIREVPFPTIGYTSDFDAHILTTAKWLRAFDIMMVCDHVYEWEKVRALSSGAVYAYPLIFGAPRNLPAISKRVRDIDVFMSGTMTSVYHPDKARLIHQLLSCSGINVLLFEGHVGLREYFELTSRAKITQSFCRHPGAMLTRAIESLSMGSIALVPEESINRLWGGEAEGVFSFDQKASPVDAIRRILRDADRHVAACERNALAVRSTFSAQRLASQFFRFCAVAATKPRRRLAGEARELSQKRHIFTLGPRPSLQAAEELSRANVDYLGKQDARHPSAALKNDIAREIALLRGQAWYFNESLPNDRVLHQEMLRHLEDAVELEPRRLVPSFNLLRLLVHFGDPSEVRRGLTLAASVIDAPADRWDIDPQDDVFPYDFSGQRFNSRKYFDCLVEGLASTLDREMLRRLILASVHHYLAVDRESPTLAEEAHALDPEFPFYQLHLAELLAQRSDPAVLRRARGLLVSLAETSIVAWRAFHLIKSIDERLGEASSDSGALRERMAVAERSLIVHEHHAERLRSAFVHRSRIRPNGQFGRVVHKSARGRRQPLASILVCGRAGYGCKPTLEALSRQTADRGAFEVIYVECFDKIMPGLLHQADTVLSCDQERFFEHRGAALNSAAQFVRGDLVVVVEPGTPPDARFIERILRHFFRSRAASPAITPNATQMAIVGGWDQRAPDVFRFVAVRNTDFDRVRRFDEHEAFAGESNHAGELLWRLQAAGIPVFKAFEEELTLIQSPPWWEATPFTERPTALAALRLIWPRLCEEGRIEPLLATAPPERAVTREASGRISSPSEPSTGPLLFSCQGYNVLQRAGKVIAVRQSLGPVDLARLTDGPSTSYGPTDVLVRDNVDLVIDAINRASHEERAWSARSAGMSARLRHLIHRVKPAVGRKLLELGFRIDDPGSRSGRMKKALLQLVRKMDHSQRPRES